MESAISINLRAQINRRFTMRTFLKVVGLLAGLCAVSAWAEAAENGGQKTEDKPAPTMPSEVTLTSGRVLRKVQVMGWKDDAVLLKSAAGLERVPFAVIKSVPLADLQAMRKAAKAEKAKTDELKREIAKVEAEGEEIKRRSAERKKELEEACEEASRHSTLMEGQTEDQVRRVLGGWTRRNEYDSGRSEQVIYELDRGETYYVYFEGGRVTSWQKFDRRSR